MGCHLILVKVRTRQFREQALSAYLKFLSQILHFSTVMHRNCILSIIHLCSELSALLLCCITISLMFIHKQRPSKYHSCAST